jgi:hypothetical protein
MPNAAAASSLHSNCPCQNAAKKYGTVSLVVVTPPIPRGAGLRPSTSPAASRPTSEQNPFAPTSLPPCMVCDWKNTFTSECAPEPIRHQSAAQDHNYWIVIYVNVSQFADAVTLCDVCVSHAPTEPLFNQVSKLLIPAPPQMACEYLAISSFETSGPLYLDLSIPAPTPSWEMPFGTLPMRWFNAAARPHPRHERMSFAPRCWWTAPRFESFGERHIQPHTWDCRHRHTVSPQISGNQNAAVAAHSSHVAGRTLFLINLT